jgi:hypothetical protein
MTVSTSVGANITVAQHISLAYKTAGLLEASQEPSASDYGLGRQLLENIVDSLETYGVFARAVTFYNLPLVAGQYIYDMPSWVMEVIHTGMYIDPTQNIDEADGETPVFQIRREEWQILSTKGSIGRPVKYFNDRNGDIQRVYLWLIPDEAGTIRFQVIRLLADANDNSATLDLQRWWNKYIQYALAAAISEAKSQPMGRVQLFEAKARLELQQCQGKANEFSGNQMTIDHGGSMPYGRMHER